MPRTTLWLLVTEKTPSRPKRMSLFSMTEPGVFQSEIAGPRSLTRSRRKSDNAIVADTTASCGPVEIDRRSDCPSRTLFSIRARSPPRSTNMPEFLSIRLRPDPRIVRPRIVTSAALMRTASPVPLPSSSAPGSPSIVTPGTAIDHVAFVDARRQVQRIAGLGVRKRLRGAFALSDLNRVRPRARRRHDPDNEGSGGRVDQRETRAEHDQTAFGWTIIRPDISICRAWQNH